jgi:hypothetical protein
MNTPEPCDRCVYLEWNVMMEDDPEYEGECSEGETMGNTFCPLFTKKGAKDEDH